MGKKIMMVTMGLDIGGAETHIVELSKELKRQGYDILIASNGGIYVPEIEAVGIRHYNVPLNTRRLNSMTRSYFLLRDIIKKEQPDVVHAHARIPAFICGLLKKTMKFPFVTTAHWVFSTKGLLKYLSHWGQRTVAVSNDIRDYLIENYGVRNEHIYVTINGIDTDKFSPAVSGDKVIKELGLDPNSPIIVHVSRLDEDRALAARRLLEIAPELRVRLPGVQIVIAGGGDRFEELNAMAEEANRAGRFIYMLGPRSDISYVVAAGDIFIGVSRAALEAMSAEKVTILAGNEGYAGVFTPNKLESCRETNFCCRECDMIDNGKYLNDILKCFALTEEQIEGLGRYGREMIFKYYSVARMASDCVKAYNDVYLPEHRIVLSGYYGFSNSGDEAILSSILDSINRKCQSSEVTVLSRKPELTARTYGCRAVERFNFLGVYKALKRCDVLISGGGSLFQDRTSTRSLLYYAFIVYAAEKMGKRVMIYANGIGPVTKERNRRIVSKVVNRADIITLRDSYSLEELRDMGVWREDIHITADPAFLIKAAPMDKINEIFRQKGVPLDKPIIMISIREWDSVQGFTKKIAMLCDALKNKYDCNIVFLAMQIPDDVVISRKTMELMENSAYILDEAYTSEELVGIIGKASLSVAMRLHALIFSAKMGVPFVGIVYDPKVKYYLDILNMHQAGTAEDFDYISAFNVSAAVIDDLNTYRDQLERKSEEMTVLADKNTKYLINLFDKVPVKKKNKYK